MPFCGIMQHKPKGKRIMKHLLFIVMATVICAPAIAASNASQARRSVSAKMVAPAGRMTSSVNQLHPTQSSSARVPVPDYDEEDAAAAAERELARKACEANNVGTINTFVWASRNSNTSNYATMIEDTEHPENNACFALVSITSNDPKIDLSGVPSKYFEMGRGIVCGDWADSDDIEKRILKAKKTTRALATTGAVVGGIGLGVGAMELFGNKAIGSAVEGQAALSGAALLRSQLLTMKQKGQEEDYNNIVKQIREINSVCSDSGWGAAAKPAEIEAICNDERFKTEFLNSL